MPGKLVICPTPLGNLGDMTVRALEALRAADVVCAEDTRVTGKLLAALGIEGKRLERLDEKRGALNADNGSEFHRHVQLRLICSPTSESDMSTKRALAF